LLLILKYHLHLVKDLNHLALVPVHDPTRNLRREVDLKDLQRRLKQLEVVQLSLPHVPFIKFILIDEFSEV
jgi:hypothetical protein